VAMRFSREIVLVKRLEHPHIVRLYDFGQTEAGLLWMALELVNGKELAAVLEQESRLSPVRAQGIMLQVLAGLSEAHRQNIIHRDLKPSNIMLAKEADGSERVKLLDFGVGKALGEQENSAIQDLTGAQGDAFGTPRYMGPELLLKGEIGPHSDVYAVGLILFETVTGFPAVPGDTVFEILARQLSTPLVMPPWLAESPLGPVIQKATSKDWRQRYPTALAFSEALAALDLSQMQVGPHCDPQVLLAAEGALSYEETLARLMSGAPLKALRREASAVGLLPVEADDPDVRELLRARRRRVRWWLVGAVAAVAVVTALLLLHFLQAPPAEAESAVVVAAPEPVVETVTPPPVLLEMVSWAFESEPPGATVQVNGRRVCHRTPCMADIVGAERPVTVYFSLDGYRSVSKSVIPNAEGRLEVQLPPLEAPAEPKVEVEEVEPRLRQRSPRAPK